MPLKYLAFIIIFFLLNGCASTAKINTYNNTGKKTNSSVFISKKDLTNKYLHAYGTPLFPIEIEVGIGLRENSNSYLGTVTEINGILPKNKGVYISLNNFNIDRTMHFLSSSTYYAELAVDVSIINAEGNNVLTKTYAGKGNVVTHSAAHSVFVRNISYTSSSAFSRVFEQIFKDVNQLK